MALSTLSVSSVGVLVMEGVLVCPEEVSLEKVSVRKRQFRRTNGRGGVGSRDKFLRIFPCFSRSRKAEIITEKQILRVNE